jgi:phosphoribosylanthranilate isomerase
MMQGRTFRHAWFLAGGLTPDNAREAAAISGAPLLDVSSGVESSPGVKDPARIAAFLTAVT